jgi:hypothetical protein
MNKNFLSTAQVFAVFAVTIAFCLVIAGIFGKLYVYFLNLERGFSTSVIFGKTADYMGGCTSLNVPNVSDTNRITFIQVLVDFSGDLDNPAWVPSDFLYNGGYRYSWYLGQGPGVNLFVCNDSTYSDRILGHKIKAIISY